MMLLEYFSQVHVPTLMSLRLDIYVSINFTFLKQPNPWRSVQLFLQIVCLWFLQL